MASKASQQCAAVDDTFGPWAGPHCRGGFDFTLLFQETLLSILPLSLLLLAAPFRIYFLWGKKIKVHKSPLLLAKLVSFLCCLVNNSSLIVTDIVGPSCCLRGCPPYTMAQRFDHPKSSLGGISSDMSRRSLRVMPSFIHGAYAECSDVLFAQRLLGLHRPVRRCPIPQLLPRPIL